MSSVPVPARPTRMGFLFLLLTKLHGVAIAVEDFHGKAERLELAQSVRWGGGDLGGDGPATATSAPSSIPLSRSISRTASIPLLPGILISINTTSGKLLSISSFTSSIAEAWSLVRS